MIRKQLIALGTAFCLSLCSPLPALANTSANTVIMENCGAYLFEWRPVDCGNGQAFAILVGQNTISESDVILNRGYDYAYNLYSLQYTQPWGTVPDLVNVNGVWGIPENWSSLPDGSQPTLRITLWTNNGNMDSNERYIDVVHLPSGTDTSTLPADVRKYLINTDGSDAGAYENTTTPGWQETEAGKMYLKPDGTYVTSSWLMVDDQYYYLNENGVMLTDAITPDGYYVNSSGERQGYIPGWYQETDGQWRYIQKNGYYKSNGWFQDADGKWYYFNMAAYLVTDSVTPDGYYVDASGAWDGNPSTADAQDSGSLGPGTSDTSSAEGWEEVAEGWRYRKSNSTYAASEWIQTADGKWYYFGPNGLMYADTTTPDGYRVGTDGAWIENSQQTAELADS